jgi:hypothetical protein
MRDAVDRLLSAARCVRPLDVPEMPFAFDTRIVALARAATSQPPHNFAIARLLRNVTIVALLIFATATAGAYWQFYNNRAAADSALTAYVMADRAISSATSDD